MLLRIRSCRSFVLIAVMINRVSCDTYCHSGRRFSNTAPLVFALFVLLLGVPIIAAADIQGFPESDERVVVFRALENQLKEEDWRDDDLRKPDCDGERYPISADGKYEKYAGKYCVITIDTGCQNGMFPSDMLGVDGYWVWIRSRIAYQRFLRDLVIRYKIPIEVFSTEFRAMDKIILNNIERKLRESVKIRDYKDGIARDSDGKLNYEKFTGMEEQFAEKWNKYVLSLSSSAGTKRPLLSGVMDGCGAGETEYEIKSYPPGGKIYLISDTDALLCSATQKDPWNTESCKGWRRVQTKTIGLVGTYRYIVHWEASGKSERDKFKIELMNERVLCLPGPCPETNARARR